MDAVQGHMAIDVAGLEDAALVQRVRQLDELAAAEIVDLYIDSIYTFCRSRVQTDEQAEVATRRTLVRATTRFAWLSDPRDLQPWLFAIARVHTDGLASRRPKRSTSRSGAEQADDLLEPGQSRVFWSGPGELSDLEHTVLELVFRHGLGDVAISRILEVKPNDIRVILQSSYERILQTIGTALLTRHGRGECEVLDEILVGWDGQFDAATRSLVSSHVGQCARCTEVRATGLSETSSLDVLGATPAPRRLREDTTRHMVAGMVLVGSGSSIETQFVKRDSQLQQELGLPSWSWAPDGFPASQRRQPQRGLVFLAAVAAFVVIIGAGVAAGLATGDPGSPSAPVATEVEQAPLEALNQGIQFDN